MANPSPAIPPDDQRKALEDSEREATTQQPETFRDRSNAKKQVEIGPDMTDDPIRGIDPPEHGSKER
jgi:hypothetical protein